jgi:hypothetical protein
MKWHAAISCVTALAGILACSAPQTATGGEMRFDAALPEGSAAGCGTDGMETTWNALYTDYFGAKWPDGPGCAGNEHCHGAAEQPGAQASAFVCGHSKDECFAGITGTRAGLVNAATPASSGLVGILRHVKDGKTVGIMPLQPTTCIFSDAAIQRIEAWMAAGANND